MGLDMYLTARRGLSKWFDEGDTSRQATISEAFPELASYGSEAVSDVGVEVGYWRKANAIHKWFVDNVQKGVDDCDSYWVDRDKLEELRQLCSDVVHNVKHADTALPTASGFFFGGTEYDQYYRDDLKQTIDIIDRCLALPKTWSFKYQSSW